MADDIEVSVIHEQVEMGVAIRMAVLDALARGLAARRAQRAMKRLAFRNARLIDPASGLDVRGGLLVENVKIADVGPRLFNDSDATRSRKSSIATAAYWRRA